MDWVETTGRTVAEAKDAALDQLGVDEEDAEFEVLEEGRGGLFGRLRAEARVRARVRPTAPRPKGEQGRGRGRARGAGQRTRTGGAARPPARAADAAPVKARDESGQGTSVPARTGRGDMVEEPSLDEQGELAEQFLAGLLDALGLGSAQVGRHLLDDETVEVAIDGEPGGLGILIGPGAQTLGAVQELTRTVVQRQTGARHGRIVVDVAGYRERRRAALEAFTRRVADEVLATGTAKALEPMNPADRKVVHDTANAIAGVATTSEGEHPHRRVVIAPEQVSG